MNFKQKVYEAVVMSGVKTLAKVFPEYFQKEPLAPTDRYIEYNFVCRNLPDKPARVLDVGCSGSYFPLILAGLGYIVDGKDIRQYPIVNKLKFANFHFNHYTPQGFYDTICLISVLEHIELDGRYGKRERQNRIDFVRELLPLLTDNGCLLITVPFGKFKVVKPFHKVYDDYRMTTLFDVCHLKVMAEEYYYQANDWVKVSKAYLKHREGLACYRLEKM